MGFHEISPLPPFDYQRVRLNSLSFDASTEISGVFEGDLAAIENDLDDLMDNQ